MSGTAGWRAVAFALLAAGWGAEAGAQAAEAAAPETATEAAATEQAAEVVAEAAPGAAAQEDGAASFNGLASRGWGLAPIRWGGSLGDDYSRRVGGGRTSVSHTQRLGLSGRTFVVHPAIASLSGGLNLSTGRSGERGGNQSRFTGTSGSLSLDLLSRTRLPTGLFYGITDSRIDGFLAATDYRREEIRLRQSWKPPKPDYTLDWSAQQASNRTTSGESKAREFAVSASTGFGEGHSLAYSLGLNDASQSDGSASRALNTSLFHGFGLEYYYRVSNSIRYQRSSADPAPGALASTTADVVDTQIYNAVMWIPSDDYPLTLNSSILLDRREQGEVGTEGGAVSLSATYPFSDRLSSTATGSVQARRSGEQRTRLTALAGSLSYRGDSRELGDYRHDWSGSVGIGTSRATAADRDNLSAGLSQSLSRAIPLASNQALSLSLSQSLASGWTSTVTESGQSETQRVNSLSHGLSLAYTSSAEGENFSSGGSFLDTRSFADSGRSAVQTLSAYASGQLTIDRQSSLSAGAGWGMSRTLGGGDESWHSSGSGSVAYQRQRPFGWRFTHYDASLTLNVRPNEQRDEDVAAGRVEDKPFLFAYTLSHGLTGRLGLLSATLRNDYAWSESGDLTWGFSFRITRTF